MNKILIIALLVLSACTENKPKMTYAEYEKVLDNSIILKHCRNGATVRKYQDKIIYISNMEVIEISTSLDDYCKGTK